MKSVEWLFPWIVIALGIVLISFGLGGVLGGIIMIIGAMVFLYKNNRKAEFIVTCSVSGVILVIGVVSMVFFTSVTKYSTTTITNTPSITQPDKSDSANIKFEYFYRGFATMHVNKEEDTYPKGTLIIQTDEDWHDFMNKYVPGIPYNIPIDFSKECLAFISSFPAKSIYSTGTDIKTFIVSGNKLEAQYIDNGPPNGIYAQNIDNIMHCFVNIVKINKSDIPKNIENIYHKK